MISIISEHTDWRQTERSECKIVNGLVIEEMVGSGIVRRET